MTLILSLCYIKLRQTAVIYLMTGSFRAGETQIQREAILSLCVMDFFLGCFYMRGKLGRKNPAVGCCFFPRGGMLTRECASQSQISSRDGEVLYVGMQRHVGSDGGLEEKLLLWIWSERRASFSCYKV